MLRACVTVSVGKSLHLALESIRPNPDNPRRDFDEGALDELADSIRSWGQLQPIVVRRSSVDGQYQLICGERRWRAHQRAGLPTIWAVEREATDADVLRLALVENLQRVGLARAEKLAALDQLAELTQVSGLRRTAAELGVDPSWLSRQLAVRKDPVIFSALEAGRLGFGQAAELLRAPEQARAGLLARIVESPGTVGTATIRAWVRDARAEAAADVADAPVPSHTPASAYVRLLRELVGLGAPQSPEDRAAVRELVARARTLLEPTPVRPVSPTLSWTELNCLWCGERAAIIEDGTLRASSPGAVRQHGRKLTCGRCDGPLTQGDRGVSYTYRAPLAAS
jgi:ParB/RepB/Spo0J family partition protein